MGRGRRGRWRWFLAALAAAALVLTLAGWLMSQHIPAWYRPVEIAPADLQRVRDDLLSTLDEFDEALARATVPFERRFTVRQMNEWLAAREAVWPLSREWLPAEFSNPCVAVDGDGVRLAATYRRGEIQTVLSARLETWADRNGLTVRLAEVACGSLRIPTSWVQKSLAALDQSVWPAGRRVKSQWGEGTLPRLGDMPTGAVFPNAWRSDLAKRPFRVIGIRFEPGAAVVAFEPLPHQDSARRNSHRWPAGSTPAN